MLSCGAPFQLSGLCCCQINLHLHHLSTQEFALKLVASEFSTKTRFALRTAIGLATRNFPTEASRKSFLTKVPDRSYVKSFLEEFLNQILRALLWKNRRQSRNVLIPPLQFPAKSDVNACRKTLDRSNRHAEVKICIGITKPLWF